MMVLTWLHFRIVEGAFINPDAIGYFVVASGFRHPYFHLLILVNRPNHSRASIFQTCVSHKLYLGYLLWNINSWILFHPPESESRIKSWKSLSDTQWRILRNKSTHIFISHLHHLCSSKMCIFYIGMIKFSWLFKRTKTMIDNSYKFSSTIFSQI